MALTDYKDIFGKPGEGSHAYRVLGVAAIDLLFTLIIIVALAWLLGKNYALPIALGAFGLGIAAHRVFGVRTTVDKALFADSSTVE